MGMRLVELAKAHRARIAAGLAALGLHVGQELLLAQLWETDGLSQAELAARLSVEPPTVAKMVRRMESAGLLARRPDPRDSRARLVTVTARGAKLQRDVERLWSRVDRALLRGLSSDEIAITRATFERMTKNLG